MRLRLFVFLLTAQLFFLTLRLAAEQITLNLVPGWNLVGIPTNVVGGHNVTNILRGAANYTSVFSTPMPTFDFATLDPDVGEWTVPFVFKPGFAYWVMVPNSPRTFTWEISGSTTTVTPLNLQSNFYYFLGSINGGTDYEDFAGGPPANDTALFRYLPGLPAGSWFPHASDNWEQFVYADGAWSPSTPPITSGEGILVVYPALRLKSTPATNSPAGFILSWPRGWLQQADSIKGPWQMVTNIAPLRVDTETQPAAARFYRVWESIEGRVYKNRSL